MVADEPDKEYIGGRHAVLEALRAGNPIHKIWIGDHVQRSLAAPIVAAAKEAGVVVQTVNRRRLDQLLPTVPHQGVIAQLASHRYAGLDDLLALAEARGEAPFLVLLDEIEDPHNLGSIIRTANASGAHGVVIPKRRAAGLTAAVAKASAGAVAHVQVARVTNMAHTIRTLKERGIWTIAATAEADQIIHELDLTVPLALVIGNEHGGIGRLVAQNCDFSARLPMYGEISSLNAAVAAGIIMYEVVRQRKLLRR